MKKLLFAFVIVLITISFVSCESWTGCGTVLNVTADIDEYGAYWKYTISDENGEHHVKYTPMEPGQYFQEGTVVCF